MAGSSPQDISAKILLLNSRKTDDPKIKDQASADQEQGLNVLFSP